MTKITSSYICGEASDQLNYATIGNHLDAIADKYPESDALIVRHQNVRWTYSEFRTEVDRLATGLLHLGIEKGDRVGIWGPNSYEWCLIQYATAKIGAILVNINPAYRLFELEYALNKVGCKAVITAEKHKTSEYLSMLTELAPELVNGDPKALDLKALPELKLIVRMGEAKSAGMLNFAEVCELGGDDEHQRLSALKQELLPDDPINIQFTSGTTGRPKGALLSHCGILNIAAHIGKFMNFTEADRLCIPVPLYHAFGMVMASMVCMATGAAAVIPGPAFDALETLEAIDEEKCTALHGVPTMFIEELDHPEFSRFDVSRLRTGIMAGSPCPEEVMKRVMQDMHMEHILIGYGQTELSSINYITLPDDPIEKRIETVGRIFPRLEAKIIDESGRVVPVGQTGEMCTRGYSVMHGYWGEEEKTKETIDAAGWLHSGDLAVMDEDGYVKIVGRIKDMIIRGGENIYPREIEEFFYTHPAIQEVQVFGVPDARMGEEVCAWIKLHKGTTVNEEEIKAFCKEKITHFKIPRYVRFVERFPMTVTGKIQKFKMREEMANISNK